MGIKDSVAELLGRGRRLSREGYLRIKLKIEPGWDIEPVRAVRERFGDGCCSRSTRTRPTPWPTRHLRRLDDFDLLLIEQPLPENDLHRARPARQRGSAPRSASTSRSARPATPPPRSRSAPAASSTSSPPGWAATSRRAGSTTSRRRPGCRCGAAGCSRRGIGRAANVALAALPNFVLPGDTSASSRYFAQDLTAPFELEDGHLRVPTGPGIGVEPIPATLRRFSVRSARVPSRGWRDRRRAARAPADPRTSA